MSAEAAEKLRRQVIDALDRLPNTAQGIADYFTEVGIKGRRFRVSGCPMAQYVATECDVMVSTPGAHVTVYPARGLSCFAVEAPPAVGEFVADFDLGRYPELVQQ